MRKLLLLVVAMMLVVMPARETSALVPGPQHASLQPQEFGILSEEPHPEDLLLDDLKDLLEDAGKVFARINQQGVVPADASGFTDACRSQADPPAYSAARKAPGASRAPLFDKPLSVAQSVLSDFQDFVDGVDPSAVLDSPPLGGLGPSQPAAWSKRTYCSWIRTLYDCPHKRHLLSWFSVRHWGSGHYDICFVPWAGSQRVTHVTCTCPKCPLSGTRKGRCLPSCYERRRLRVLCYRYRSAHKGWYWTSVTRNLPQACRCSSR